MKKIAVITGASSGMGRRFAETIEQYGTFDEVWIIARRPEGSGEDGPRQPPQASAAMRLRLTTGRSPTASSASR